MERWEICKGSQSWPVLQDVIRIDWKINTVWNGNIPFHWCPQRVRLPPWVSEGLGTPNHELFWRQWLQQVAGEAIVEIWMCFPLGSPPGKDRKILVPIQLPCFFFTLLGMKALQSMRGTLRKASAFGLYKLHESVPMHRWKGGLKEEGTKEELLKTVTVSFLNKLVNHAWHSVIFLSIISTCQVKTAQLIHVLGLTTAPSIKRQCELETENLEVYSWLSAALLRVRSSECHWSQRSTRACASASHSSCRHRQCLLLSRSAKSNSSGRLVV